MGMGKSLKHHEMGAFGCTEHQPEKKGMMHADRFDCDRLNDFRKRTDKTPEWNPISVHFYIGGVVANQHQSSWENDII
ncbi:hypothetical protein [Maribacter sp. 2307ULW6-5]|uniref:hypothetical protein n=1 Tax=Maribacter sp. 2307ULW6-5 TaxID=3386275 RepID=UPI0039BC89C0